MDFSEHAIPFVAEYVENTLVLLSYQCCDVRSLGCIERQLTSLYKIFLARYSETLSIQYSDIFERWNATTFCTVLAEHSSKTLEAFNTLQFSEHESSPASLISEKEAHVVRRRGMDVFIGFKNGDRMRLQSIRDALELPSICPAIVVQHILNYLKSIPIRYCSTTLILQNVHGICETMKEVKGKLVYNENAPHKHDKVRERRIEKMSHESVSRSHKDSSIESSDKKATLSVQNDSIASRVRARREEPAQQSLPMLRFTTSPTLEKESMKEDELMPIVLSSQKRRQRPQLDTKKEFVETRLVKGDSHMKHNSSATECNFDDPFPTENTKKYIDHHAGEYSVVVSKRPPPPPLKDPRQEIKGYALPPEIKKAREKCASVFHEKFGDNKKAGRLCVFCLNCHMLESLFNGATAECELHSEVIPSTERALRYRLTYHPRLCSVAVRRYRSYLRNNRISKIPIDHVLCLH